jgi:hypothetical protein
MKKREAMKKFAALTLSLFLMTGTAFADSPKDTPKDTPKATDAQPAKTTTAAKTAAVKTNAEIAAEMEELRQALQAQQEQLQLLKEELAKRDKQIEEAREAAASANSRATEASVKATEAVNTSAEVKSTATALNNSVADLAASKAAAASPAADPNAPVASAGGQGGGEKGPTTIRFKGVDITPGGFVEAATVNRQRALASDINTPFNSIPFGGNSEGKLSEMNFSARQSRLTMLFGSTVGTTKLSGYFEADFLGAGTTSNNRQSNSYVFRQRQIWARADFESGWAFSAGQMWSLATENKKGIVNRGEWLPMMVDPQYVVGFTWQRADAARLSKSFGDKLTLAVSAEGPQATIGGRGFSTVTTAVAGGAAATTSQNFFEFAPGAGGGLYNAFDATGYPANKLPDFIVKAAFDPGWGHYEVFGIASTFRNRVYPCAVVTPTGPNAAGTVIFAAGSAPINPAGCVSATGAILTSPSAVGAFNDTRAGGGAGASFDVPLFAKKVDLGLKAFYGDGTGRFGSAQLADATVRNDGQLALIHGGHWLGRLEWHPSPKLDIYGYVGGEYAARAAYSGYESVAITTTPAIPGCGGVGQPACAGAPAGTVQYGVPSVSTYKTSTSGIGGYGSPFANNSGCSTEAVPTGTSTPSAGGACAGDTRYIMEGTLGFWHKFYQGEKGRMQWGLQYSYFYRTAWSGSGGVAAGTAVGPHSVDNMVWTSFRYYLP